MKNLRNILIPVLLLALPGTAAERLKTKPEVETLEHFKNNRPAGLREWQHPNYPPEPGADWAQAVVRVALAVDSEGHVTDTRALSGPERFHAAALAAVARWKFRPALVDGQPAPDDKEVRIIFEPTGTPKRTPQEDFMPPYRVEDVAMTEPGDPANPDPIYPKFLAPRQLAGEVELVLGISPAGRVDGVQVIRATHPDFLSAALETVAGWEVTPARQGRRSFEARKRSTLQFFVVDETGERNDAGWLERNGIHFRDEPATKVAGYFDQRPEAVVMVDPVYPHELALAGTRGAARVDFSVGHRGQVFDATVVEATHPEFGEAVAAAITAWHFMPLRRNGEICGADFSITWRFKEPRADSTEQRLLANQGTENQPVSARLLDRPLHPLHIRPPLYPAARLDALEAGAAEIEVTIDREGRVRLPRIRSATHPGFGWAAATAVSQWLFETPRKDGQPVDVRVVVPVKFKAPEPPPPEVPRPEVPRSEVPRVEIQP